MIRIIVPSGYLDRARVYGEEMAAAYGRGESEQSRLVGFNKRRIDEDPIEQMNGKIGEVAAALGSGVDPETLRWSAGFYADPGFDFMSKKGAKVDAKTTAHPRGTRLIWPASKASFFDEVDFDVMILVWMAAHNSPSFGVCELRGWIEKARFKEVHKVSDGNDGFIAGTMFVKQSDLHPLGHDDHQPLPVTSPYRNDHRCHCGAYGTHGRGLGPIETMIWFCGEHAPL